LCKIYIFQFDKGENVIKVRMVFSASQLGKLIMCSIIPF